MLASQQPLARGDRRLGRRSQRWADQIVELKPVPARELGCPLGTLAGELAATDNAARALLDDAFCEWERRLRNGLATMRDHGLLHADADIDDLATATIASLQGGLLLAKTAPLDPTVAHRPRRRTEPPALVRRGLCADLRRPASGATVGPIEALRILRPSGAPFSLM